MQGEIDQPAIQLEEFDVVVDIDKVAMNKALLNPVILHKVFCSLDTPTLKSVRLVCTLWAEVGATILGKQGRLPFSTPPTCEELTSFNPKLARNIELLFRKIIKCHCIDDCSCPPNLTNLPSNFVIILPQISDKLETLELLGVKTFEPLQEIWSTYHFARLTHISIIANGVYLDKMTPPAQVSPSCREPSSKDFMSTICHNLVNSAPNLEEIDLKANFYWDLTACGKLKTFQVKHYSWGGVQSEIYEMTKMLESCGHSLETLTLDYLGSYNGPIELDLHFPNLTHLRLHATHVYSVEASVNIINLPKLTHFSLLSNATFKRDISSILQHYHLRHIGITSLDMSCFHYPKFDNVYGHGQAARRLVNLFPAVKELKLKMLIQYVSSYGQYFLALMETVQSFDDWELTCGQIEFEIASFSVSGVHNYSYPDQWFGSELVLIVLKGMAGWRGLRNTSLQFTGNEGRQAGFRLLGEMRDVLLSCRTIRSLTIAGFLMDEQTKDNFQTFIGDHNLPISLTD
ncbi:uncharacterized protein LOC110850285 isoform X2 [Folsomia candida]|uniref:uncharacterized protein LOC110850285 isoform X2 n=1 Tax=Folsomia candida TaxID=158441 RepID=UPI0016055EBE|nr:uncharacterized protein LOC110850285 isoform X2 [Folsomia candida]